MTLKRLHVFLGAVLIYSTNSLAQEYPYDNPTAPEPTDTQSVLPKESPSQDSRSLVQNTPARSVTRLSFRVGGNWAFFQVPQETGSLSESGFGIEGIFGIGWDFRFYPAFVELETGYRMHFIQADEPFHIIPLTIGTYFRTRIGARSTFKWGFKGGLDFRYSSFVNTSGLTQLDWGIVPHWGLAAQWELGSLLIEPFVYINRIQKDFMFLSGGLRTGLRF
jgi:hypothetical protein